MDKADLSNFSPVSVSSNYLNINDDLTSSNVASSINNCYICTEKDLADVDKVLSLFHCSISNAVYNNTAISEYSKIRLEIPKSYVNIFSISTTSSDSDSEISKSI